MAPYRVLDLTDESGDFCTKVLVDLGADVIRIEPPGGHPTRHNEYVFLKLLSLDHEEYATPIKGGVIA